jgi:hypothetical protein
MQQQQLSLVCVLIVTVMAREGSRGNSKTTSIAGSQRLQLKMKPWK